jgi:integrase
MAVGFIIMQIGNADLDRVCADAIVPAIEAAGLAAKRVDKHNVGGLLKSETIAFIQQADIIVADLTNERPNCYLEIGYAMGLDKFTNLILTARRNGVYPVYAPYIFAAIDRKSISDTARDRSFEIQMARKSTRIKMRPYDGRCESRCKPIRKQLYLAALTNASAVADTYESAELQKQIDEIGLHDRAAGIWKSILTIGTILEPGEVRQLISLAREMSPDPDRQEEQRQISIVSAERLKVGKARATVNRESGALKQALNLARKQARLTRVPYIPMLREDNARQGFFEHADFEKFVAFLPDPINDIARFAYLTGWRRGEIVSLTWDAVDRQSREVRLRTSKNGQGRSLPLNDDLWQLMERRWAARTIQKKDGTTKLSAFVFHRNGNQVVDFRKSWKDASKQSHIHVRLFHDLRRTAVRNMIRAGVGQSVAMSISGHKTVSMFNRYNITSAADKIDALRKTAEHLAAQPTKKDDGSVVEFKGREAVSQ